MTTDRRMAYYRRGRSATARWRVLHIRVNEAEYGRLASEAKSVGLRLSALVRKKLGGG